MQKISTMLWFNGDAEEAANFYVSVFRDGKVGEPVRVSEAGPGPVGSVLTVPFNLLGQDYTALNGGPQFPFTEAISLVVDCKDQAEVDHYWDALLAGGGEGVQCGWLKDRFGLRWQVTPSRLIELISSPDPGVAKRVTEAMFGMVKIDIAAIEAAAKAA